MKWILIAMASSGIMGLGLISKNKQVHESKKINPHSVMGTYAPVAVLELFTSEGCSSCPPADKLLPALSKKDSNIISLSFHVDYWNRLGWTDPFSKAEYSERQRAYSSQFNLESVYTPQLVVNGVYELVGSNRNKAESSISESLKKKATVQLSINNVKENNNIISFVTYAEGDIKNNFLLAALVQKKVTVEVKAGENRGASLSHTNVVRDLSMQTVAAKNEVELKIPEDLDPNEWQVVVYTQQKNDLKITGAVVYKTDTQ